MHQTLHSYSCLAEVSQSPTFTITDNNNTTSIKLKTQGQNASFFFILRLFFSFCCPCHFQQEGQVLSGLSVRSFCCLMLCLYSLVLLLTTFRPSRSCNGIRRASGQEIGNQGHKKQMWDVYLQGAWGTERPNIERWMTRKALRLRTKGVVGDAASMKWVDRRKSVWSAQWQWEGQNREQRQMRQSARQSASARQG